ncbi:MAG: hypothetical protein AMK72_09640 [Planctomycetes bacterium SM23_25]|nr:MAG: hypothetical protein AMK72_09640 [Planctomycetes bacterium SM23_25]
MNSPLRRSRHVAAQVLTIAGLALLVAGCRQAAEQRQLTILLVEYKGPEAADSAQRLVKELASQGLSDAYTVEGVEYAGVCVGRYDSWKDPEADRMLKRVRVIRDGQGQYPFAGVMLVPVPEPLPKNPWPLEEVDGLFSLHIASWEAPGRMVSAQQYAGALRSRGYEAYVYHGPRLSMVTLGAFGMGIFDDPGKVGRPKAKPKIVDAKVLALIKEFPRMRLEGQETPPEAHVPTQLVRVPGKEPTGTAVARPKTLYRVTLSFVDTTTGLAEGRLRASGVAQGEAQLPTLVGALVKQLMAALPGDKVPRVGVVGVLADDPTAAGGRLDVTVLQALNAALQAAGAGKIRLFSQEGTRQMLDAARLVPEAVLRDPRPVKGFEALDYVVIASLVKTM